MIRPVVKRENVGGNDVYVLGWVYEKDGFSTTLTWIMNPATADIFREDWDYLLECIHAGIATSCRLNTPDLFAPSLQLNYVGGGGDITVSDGVHELGLKSPVVRREFIDCCKKIAEVHMKRPS
jgi:hypothetical protein